MFDTHTHICHKRFSADRAQTYERAREAGVALMLEVGWDLRSSEEAIRFAERHEGVWVAIGYHPHDSRNTPNTPNYLARLEDLAKHEKVKAIGEIGLDFYRDLSPRDIQKRVFIEQIELADELKLPMVIHCRDAMPECLPLVEERGYYFGVFHSAAADTDEAKRIVELGFYLGVNGTLTYDGKRTKGWIPKVPRERLLIETDCPYLTPEPYRRERNEPAYVRYVAEALAEVLGIQVDALAELTEENGKRLFLG
jgi:TatD DNase family protein